MATGRPKNQIVLDALVAYLRPRSRSVRRPPRLRSYRLGATPRLRRADLYEERADAKGGRARG